MFTVTSELSCLGQGTGRVQGFSSPRARLGQELAETRLSSATSKHTQKERSQRSQSSQQAKLPQGS